MNEKNVLRGKKWNLDHLIFFLHVYCIISRMFRYPLETRRHKHFSLSRLLTPLSLKCPRDRREERQSLEESQCLAAGQRPRAAGFWEDRRQSISWERESPSGEVFGKDSTQSNPIVFDLLWFLWCYCFSWIYILFGVRRVIVGILNQRMNATRGNLLCGNWLRKSLNLKSLKVRVTSKLKILVPYPSI